MRINTNVGSLNAWRNLSATDGTMSKNLERLSSGFRINRAGDDVAGLAISENMRAQVKGLNQAVKNAQDGISLLNTAEGSLNEVHTMLHRMRELAVQSANGTLQPADRKQIQTEMDNLAKEVTRITNATQFNGMDLIDGSLTKAGVRDISLQIGPNGGQTSSFEIGAMDANSLGITRDVLAGVVDNTDWLLDEATVTTGNLDVTAVTAYGAGIDQNKAYRIVLDDNTTDTLQLQSSTDGGVTWGNVGAATNMAAGPLVVGNGTESITVTGAAGGTLAADAFINITGHGRVVGQIGEVGAGMVAGSLQVAYDASTQRVQLKDALGVNIGADVDVKAMAGKTITLGDENTARTVSITLSANLPAASFTDKIKLASSSGFVRDDQTTNILANNGVGQVGTGLVSGNYQVVALTATTAQLRDMAGNAIGSAVTVANNGTFTLGDAATNRTVSVTFGTVAAGTAIIAVNNNEQHAAAAKFTGGTKKLNAQAHAGLNVSSVDGAQKALAAIDTAIGKVSFQRSQLGAITNRLEHTISNLQVVSENLTAAESRIRDVDMAMEMAQFTKNQILMQSGTAMLAQANQKNQAVLQLLR